MTPTTNPTPVRHRMLSEERAMTNPTPETLRDRVAARADTTNIRNRLEASAKAGGYNERNFVDVPAHELRAMLTELDSYRAAIAAMPRLSPEARETIRLALDDALMAAGSDPALSDSDDYGKWSEALGKFQDLRAARAELERLP